MELRKLCTYLASLFIGLYCLTNFSSLVALAAADPSGSQASDESSGVTISPPMFDFSVKRGDTVSQKIKISNPSSAIVELYPISMNFTSEGDGGQPKFFGIETGDQKYSLASWISISQPKIAIAPQQVTDFSYEIKVPTDAEPGGHYGVLFFTTQPPEASGTSTKVSISSMIGSLIMATVDGQIKESAVLQSVSVPKILMSGPLNIKTRVTNTGNVHLKPIGEIDITGSLTGDRSALVFNTSRGNILPESTRLFTDTWNYNMFKNIGPHRVEVKLLYGSDAKSLTSSSVVWILPWWLIAAVIILLILIVVLIIVIKKRRANKFNKFFKAPTK